MEFDLGGHLEETIKGDTVLEKLVGQIWLS